MTNAVRLYGYSRSENSFTQVTRGLQRALDSMGELAGMQPVDMEEYGAEHPSGTTSPISLNVGAPAGLLHAHRVGQHHSHWLLLAPNSEGLPKGIIAALREPSEILKNGLLTGGLLTPSVWAQGVISKVTDLPVIVAPHGVMVDIHRIDSDARDTARAVYQKGRFDVLHMTSSEHERKGTKPLLRAWQLLKQKKALPENALLHIVMNPMHLSKLDWWCRDVGLTEKDVAKYPGFAHSQSAVVDLYSAMHVICQPSRGEGFGMVPLEALCCGVPVVATACTGHSEYLSQEPPGFVPVTHGELAPMDDYPGSVAPSVKTQHIADALATSYQRWTSLAAMAERHAEALRTEWSWERKNVPALKRMIQEAEHVRK